MLVVILSFVMPYVCSFNLASSSHGRFLMPLGFALVRVFSGKGFSSFACRILSLTWFRFVPFYSFGSNRSDCCF